MVIQMPPFKKTYRMVYERKTARTYVYTDLDGVIKSLYLPIDEMQEPIRYIDITIEERRRN